MSTSTSTSTTSTPVKQELYHCTATGEDIPLSFTGRHLLQNLREAIMDLSGIYSSRVSEARGALAKYMSRLERRDTLKAASLQELVAEMQRRFQTVGQTGQTGQTVGLAGQPHAYGCNDDNCSVCTSRGVKAGRFT